MLESNEDKIKNKKTPKSKKKSTEKTNDKVEASSQINNDDDSQEVAAKSKDLETISAEKVTDDKKEATIQDKPTSEITEESPNKDTVLKENDSEDEMQSDDQKSDDKVETIAYDTLSLEELTEALDKLLQTQKVHHIKSSVEAIKTAFNSKFGALLADKKSAFLAEGGDTIDFQYSSPVKSKYNKLLSDYKKQKDLHYSNLEKQLKDNLEKRNQVIDELKSLIENADTKTMYKNFRDLQNTWRSIGPVSKTKYNDTWKIYHHHVERFYDLLHLSNDLRDLDFKNNLEEKLKLIERAEYLAEMKDVNAAFKELQVLHKTWKEDVGPVAREMRDEVWNKFSAATKIIHDKRHDHFKIMKSQYVIIIEAKMLVIDEILNYDTSENKTHNDWQKSIKDIDALRKKYFDAGKLPYSKSEAIWKKFKDATKQFNQQKNKFYKQEKSSQQKNLQAKLDLIKIAESIKDSEDWETSTNTFKKIQSDWKKIGHVPRKFSDDIWNKFKTACNHYFDRYHNQKNALSDEQKEIVTKKNEFVESLKVDDYSTKDGVTNLINAWNELGNTPKGSRAVDIKFNKFVDHLLSKLSLDKSEIVLLKFKNIINGYLANNDNRKLDSELIFVRKKIDESVREIQQLENNLSFFSNASDDNPMVKKVHKNIETFKEGLKVWKAKLAYLRSLEY
ncbi:MAG: DUF349 domain-containing protein [Flavobacteriaceae bacterium]